jgi:GNAT superfamily N-acetyltransferase
LASATAWSNALPEVLLPSMGTRILSNMRVLQGLATLQGSVRSLDALRQSALTSVNARVDAGGRRNDRVPTHRPAHGQGSAWASCTVEGSIMKSDSQFRREALGEAAWQQPLRDGTQVTIRALHAQDVELERRFIETLSPESRRFRFLETMSSPSEALLRQLTMLDPLKDVAYLAIVGTGPDAHEIGVARFSAAAGASDCEFAVTVSDEWQRKGLGAALMAHLIDAARVRGIHAMHSSDSFANDSMRRFAGHLKFHKTTDPDDARLVLYSVKLD